MELLHYLLLCASFFLLFTEGSTAFSGTDSNGPKQPAFTISDRFKAICPADIGSIYEYDPNLVKRSSDSQDCTWVAVFRSNNNLPSVLIKDEFMNAMRIATSIDTDATSSSVNSSDPSGKIEVSPTKQSERVDKRIGINAQRPVAIAKLLPSADFPKQWMIETMRCHLKMEDTDFTCDGQSEHAEAIGVCIDELIIYHLKQGRGFDGGIRTKATLLSGKLVEERGFREVTELSRDMATHVSSLDDSMEKYAERVVTIQARSPGARDRALQIISSLGQLDREKDKTCVETDETDRDDKIDPWANMKKFI